MEEKIKPFLELGMSMFFFMQKEIKIIFAKKKNLQVNSPYEILKANIVRAANYENGELAHYGKIEKICGFLLLLLTAKWYTQFVTMVWKADGV